MDRGLGAECFRLFLEVQSEQLATQLAALTLLLGIGLRLEESRWLRRAASRLTASNSLFGSFDAAEVDLGAKWLRERRLLAHNHPQQRIALEQLSEKLGKFT